MHAPARPHARSFLLVAGLVACLGAGLAVTATTPAADSGPSPEDDRQVRLGRLLFFDASLSEPAGQACASCHQPARAFTDPDDGQPTSKGVHAAASAAATRPRRCTWPSPPPSTSTKEGHYVGGQFWDGRAATLEEQAKGPFLNPLEMANPDKRAVVEKGPARALRRPVRQGPTARTR
jgi:cytochrome c peroxidase